MQVQVEQQLYPDTMSFGSKLWNNDTFFKMANGGSTSFKISSLIDIPEECQMC